MSGKKATTDSTSGSAADGTKTVPTFFIRISGNPWIRTGVDTVASTKLGQFAIDTTHSTLDSVYKVAEPYQGHFQPIIIKADGIANNIFSTVETTFPIVKEEPMKVIENVKKPFDQTIVSSKKAFDTHIATPVTAVAKNVNQRVAPLVDGAHGLLDKYLPPTDEATSIPDASADGPDSNQAARIALLSYATQLRLRKRLSAQLTSANIPQSKEDLRRLTETSVLLSRATETIDSLNQRLKVNTSAVQQKLQELTTAVMGELDEKKVLPAAVAQRIHDLSIALIGEIDVVADYVKTHARQFPEYVQVRLAPLIKFFNERYEVVLQQVHDPELNAVQKAKNILKLTTDETLPLLRKSALEIRDTIQQYKVTLNNNVNEVTTQVTTRVTEVITSAKSTLVGAH